MDIFQQKKTTNLKTIFALKNQKFNKFTQFSLIFAGIGLPGIPGNPGSLGRSIKTEFSTTLKSFDLALWLNLVSVEIFVYCDFCATDLLPPLYKSNCF